MGPGRRKVTVVDRYVIWLFIVDMKGEDIGARVKALASPGRASEGPRTVSNHIGPLEYRDCNCFEFSQPVVRIESHSRVRLGDGTWAFT
jgi:hypothetical protein